MVISDTCQWSTQCNIMESGFHAWKWRFFFPRRQPTCSRFTIVIRIKTQARFLCFSETLARWKGFGCLCKTARLILDFPPLSYQLLKTNQSDLVSLTNQIGCSELVPSQAKLARLTQKVLWFRSQSWYYSSQSRPQKWAGLAGLIASTWREFPFLAGDSLGSEVFSSVSSQWGLWVGAARFTSRYFLRHTLVREWKMKRTTPETCHPGSFRKKFLVTIQPVSLAARWKLAEHLPNPVAYKSNEIGIRCQCIS